MSATAAAVVTLEQQHSLSSDLVMEFQHIEPSRQPERIVSPIDALVLHDAPELDRAWLEYEKQPSQSRLSKSLDPLVRQPLYAEDCRALHDRMMAPGARDFHLSHGIQKHHLTVPSSLDNFAIPVIRYQLSAEEDTRSNGTSSSGSNGHASTSPAPIVIVYYHGGGLYVGEADSEELSCRRILKDSGLPTTTSLYSVGYRLMPSYPASTCIQDSVDAFASIQQTNPGVRFIIIGSSSGGQVAALVSQAAPKGSVHGVVLRCPVTSDAFNGPEYVPLPVRALHTTAWNMAFANSLLGVMKRKVPRDGLARMPLEADEDELRGLPRHWIQVCSNDMLYSDGICYAKALENAGVEVEVGVVHAFPHTFWLVAPHLPQSLEADKAMLKGLAWVTESI